MESINTIEAVFPWFIPAVVFIFGAIWGSFLNVVIHRLPEGRSVVSPPSSCVCGQRIPFYHNIPLVSWLFLRGKAACCELPLTVRYWVVEVLTALLFLLLWLAYTPAIASVGMVFFALLIAASFIDLEHMIIPDVLSIGGMFAGVLLSIFIPEIHGFSSGSLHAHASAWIEALLGVFVGTSMVYWIATLGELLLKKPAMGEGDMKFLAAIGAFTGWQGALFALFGGAFIGTLIILPWMLWRQIQKSEEPRVQELPFGPFLAIGAVLHFLYVNSMVDAYFNQIAELLFL